MLIDRHEDLAKDFKKLKRWPASIESLEAWERYFCFKGLLETPGIVSYPGFGDTKIYKARVVPLKEKCGKSRGYRLIFKLVANNAILLLLFSRHGVYNDEKELADIIKKRIK
ncbi:MAG: hypothetical protein WC531_00940 [Candidatus Paceibacterota bacterium]|jgi:hypothetical protein